MSYIISGLNLSGIYEYSSAEQYEKYDIVDYQLNDSEALFPDYQGLGGESGIAFWFSNDYIANFTVDETSSIEKWSIRNNRVSYAEDQDPSVCLSQSDTSKRPVINLNSNFTILKGSESLAGDVGELNNRTFFICFEALPFSDTSFDAQNIFSVSDDQNFSSNVGSIKIKGDDSYVSPSSQASIVIDGVDYSAANILYNQPNILTIVQSYNSDTLAKNIIVRQNGLEVANLNTFNAGWLGEYLKIGDNPNNQGIKYYDFFCHDVVLPDYTIKSYEKYLYETYFNNEGLYFAKKDVPAGALNGPLTPVGTEYWTKNIDDLFTLSYGCSVSFSAELSKANLGDGYQSNVARNINSLNSKFDLKYEGLTDKQAKSLIGFFENTPENENNNINEGFSGVKMNLFPPYKTNSELYFLDISHQTPYNNINNISISAESLYDSSLDYKGMLVQLDETNIRTYSNDLSSFEYNDVVYFDSSSISKRGYYYYTGEKTQRSLSEANSPIGENSYFTNEFYFKNDIDYDINSNIRLNTIDYEGSSKQYLKDGLNYNLLEFDLTFSNRTNKEALALLKFLDSKAGFKTFDYTLPQPYNKKIQVFCPEWSHTYNFLNNNEITMKFKEFKSEPKRTTVFNTKVFFDAAPTTQNNVRNDLIDTILYGRIIEYNGLLFSEKTLVY